MTTIIKTENLTHTYGISTPFEKTAVDDVSLEIYPGELIGVIGRTGSGKSTLIQHFNGIIKPTSGKIYFNGSDCWEKGFSRTKLRFSVGLVFQYPEYQLFEETVEKDIAYGPKNMGLSEEEIAERVRYAIKFAGLDESFLDKSPFDLSGGQKRRVAIAGIIAMKPELLILDEPTAGLDPRGRDEILGRLTEYRQQEKTTVMFVSHSMEDVAMRTEKILVMDHGKLAMFAPVDEVFDKADKIREMGLDVPQITRVFIDLKSRGIDVPLSVYTIDKAASVISEMKGGKK